MIKHLLYFKIYLLYNNFCYYKFDVFQEKKNFFYLNKYKYLNISLFKFIFSFYNFLFFIFIFFILFIYFLYISII